MGLNFFVGEVQAQASAAAVVGQQATQAAGLLQDGINFYRLHYQGKPMIQQSVIFQLHTLH